MSGKNLVPVEPLLLFFLHISQLLGFELKECWTPMIWSRPTRSQNPIPLLKCRILSESCSVRPKARRVFLREWLEGWDFDAFPDSVKRIQSDYQDVLAWGSREYCSQFQLTRHFLGFGIIVCVELDSCPLFDVGLTILGIKLFCATCSLVATVHDWTCTGTGAPQDASVLHRILQ